MRASWGFLILFIKTSLIGATCPSPPRHRRPDYSHSEAESSRIFYQTTSNVFLEMAPKPGSTGCAGTLDTAGDRWLCSRGLQSSQAPVYRKHTLASAAKDGVGVAARQAALEPQERRSPRGKRQRWSPARPRLSASWGRNTDLCMSSAFSSSRRLTVWPDTRQVWPRIQVGLGRKVTLQCPAEQSR